MRDLWDKPWFSVLTKLTYSAYLNILWLICSLPIFTIGASTTALFYCTLKMAEDRDEGLTRMFFRAFRSNFKPATKLWLILLALGCFLGVDGFVLSRLWNTSAFWTILTALVIGAAVLYAIVLLYAFPLLARFENTTLGILRTSFAVGVRYLFCTLLMAFIYAVMGWITVCVFAPAFLLGMGLCAMLCSFLLVKLVVLSLVVGKAVRVIHPAHKRGQVVGRALCRRNGSAVLFLIIACFLQNCIAHGCLPVKLIARRSMRPDISA
jgi:uncharacterized membrane protein YesL